MVFIPVAERFDISHNFLSGVLPSEICSSPLMLGCHLEATHFENENKTACAGRCPWDLIVDWLGMLHTLHCMHWPVGRQEGLSGGWLAPERELPAEEPRTRSPPPPPPP
jgi:hypothetical protein